MFFPLLDTETHKIVDQDRIRVAIPADHSGRPLQRSSSSIVKGVNATRVKIEMIGIRTRAVVVWILGRSDSQTTGHAQDVGNANFGARITCALPLGDGRGLR